MDKANQPIFFIAIFPPVGVMSLQVGFKTKHIKILNTMSIKKQVVKGKMGQPITLGSSKYRNVHYINCDINCEYAKFENCSFENCNLHEKYTTFKNCDLNGVKIK